jgi:hypothetical protein
MVRSDIGKSPHPSPLPEERALERAVDFLQTSNERRLASCAGKDWLLFFLKNALYMERIIGGFF